MKRTGMVAALVLLVASACGPASGRVATGSPSAGRSTAPVLATLDRTCSLPIATVDAPAGGTMGSGVVGGGGFVEFPSRKFVSDVASMSTFVSGHWVPVPRSWVSPDGSRFAYVINNGEAIAHVVTIATGQETTITVTPPTSVASPARVLQSGEKVVAFESDGIYLETVPANSDVAPYGLALLDPVTGGYEPHLFRWVDSIAGPMSPEHSYLTVHNGIAYSGSQVKGSDTIPNLGPLPHFNEIFSTPLYGFRYGMGQVWSSDSWVWLIGFDGDEQPIVAAESASSYRIYTGNLFGDGLVSAPVFVGKPGDPNNPTGAVGDGRGIWFGSDSGVIWYYPGAGAQFEPVAVAPFHPVRIAGLCAAE